MFFGDERDRVSELELWLNAKIPADASLAGWSIVLLEALCDWCDELQAKNLDMQDRIEGLEMAVVELLRKAGEIPPDER